MTTVGQTPPRRSKRKMHPTRGFAPVTPTRSQTARKVREIPDFGQEVKLGLLLRRTDLDDEQTEAVFSEGEGCS